MSIMKTQHGFFTLENRGGREYYSVSADIGLGALPGPEVFRKYLNEDAEEAAGRNSSKARLTALEHLRERGVLTLLVDKWHVVDQAFEEYFPGVYFRGTITCEDIHLHKGRIYCLPTAVEEVKAGIAAWHEKINRERLKICKLADGMFGQPFPKNPLEIERIMVEGKHVLPKWIPAKGGFDRFAAGFGATDATYAMYWAVTKNQRDLIEALEERNWRSGMYGAGCTNPLMYSDPEALWTAPIAK
jgi:hypothetical protein